MRKKDKHGFSLVELLMTMGVIAVLISIAVYGLSILQRNARNAQRTEMVNELKIGVEKYFLANGTYPAAGQITYSSSTEEFSVGSSITLDLNAPYSCPAPDTTKDGTAYCYVKDPNGDLSTYQLGMKNESGIWTSGVGTHNDDCGDSNVVVFGSC
ncbi:type II secretion system protein [Candidatus Dojkabacteria bacterium]|uniref:Type II secretion system protein n=1 Tax=Candidatus Dojkabacteria bacterium TaxID=2099670 RepID=A0A955L775_9BACT|nr:type II secretion system protein [Candidatus Dojkabacteria bacterium]